MKTVEAEAEEENETPPTPPWTEEAAVKVVSEPELVLRLMTSVVVVVELKLMLWRSSEMRSSAHGSITSMEIKSRESIKPKREKKKKKKSLQLLSSKGEF